MLIRPHHIFYFNNTKENKGNTNLKLVVSLFETKLSHPLTLLSIERVESLTARYIVRIQNQAEYDDAYAMNDNVVKHDMTSITKSLRLSVGDVRSLRFPLEGRGAQSVRREHERLHRVHANDLEGSGRQGHRRLPSPHRQSERGRIRSLADPNLPAHQCLTVYPSIVNLIYFVSVCLFPPTNTPYN